jgi:signal transduction histidine kinase
MTDSQIAAEVADALRGFSLFSDLGEDDLERLTKLSERIPVRAGQTLFEEGSPGDRFYVILEGEMEVTRTDGGQTVILAVLGPGSFLSEMSLLEDQPRTASARAIGDSELLAIEPCEFRNLLATSSGAALTMLKTVTARLRSTESSLVEKGRLAGLGTLAAGLAHELNNPATANLRSSSLLRESLIEWGRRCAGLRGLKLGEPEVEAMGQLESLTFRGPEVSDDPGTSGQRELDLEAWLGEQGIDDAWALAATLADAGWDRDSLGDLLEQVDPSNLKPLLHWATAGAEAHGLVMEIQRGSKAISAIVGSVRSYSKLDRGPVQVVDVAESIRDTLAILKSKLDGITVAVAIPPGLPEIEAYGGELNQVWTNLIDNALDAMERSGRLDIAGKETDEGIVVSISDTGSGIAPEARPRIFDPFFTTKPQGHGTGLGLAITYGIVVNRHRGTIQVDSRPGRTVFEVALPQRMKRE